MSTTLPAWDEKEGGARASDLFFRTYGALPAGVWSAPGRVNLVGEHTDYNDGLCLPIALPHRTFVALRPRTDGPAGRRVRLVSAQESGMAKVALDAVGPVGG